MELLKCQNCKSWFNTCRNTSNTNDEKCPYCGCFNGYTPVSYFSNITDEHYKGNNWVKINLLPKIW